MSLIQHQMFPRSSMNWWQPSSMMQPMPMTQMMGPMGQMMSNMVDPLLPSLTSLDLFDPFDDVDNMINRNLQWLNKPLLTDTMLPLMPRVPNKYRVSVDCAGFLPENIKTEIKDKNKLIVSGRQEQSTDKTTGDFAKLEFKKSYQLPENSITDQMISFMSGNQLIVEVPLRETEQMKNVHLWPQQINNKDGTKSIQMKFDLPQNIDASKVNVSVKDHDLIVRIEDKVKNQDGSSRFHYYQRTTLPEQTRLDHLKCVQENNQVVCTAPLDTKAVSYRTIPIQNVQTQKSVQK